MIGSKTFYAPYAIARTLTGEVCGKGLVVFGADNLDVARGGLSTLQLGERDRRSLIDKNPGCDVHFPIPGCEDIYESSARSSQVAAFLLPTLRARQTKL